MKKALIIAIVIVMIAILILISKNSIRNKMINLVKGAKIPDELKVPIERITIAANNDGILLVIEQGERSPDEQIARRKANVIDKSKVNDINYIMTAPADKFFPVTAIPGTSMHERKNGVFPKAIDIQVTGKPKVYDWLKNNAHKFGFYRTVPSEFWHWEFLPHLTLAIGKGQTFQGQIFNT